MSLAPVKEEVTATGGDVAPDTPWITIVWNDPVNLMSYVTWVLQNHFGYSRKKSEKLMMDVHTKGRAVGARGRARTPGTWPSSTRSSAPPSRG